MVRVLPAPGQTSLDFTSAPDPEVVATIEDLERVVRVLERGGTMTAAEICTELGLPITENTKRKIRAIAQAGRPKIVSFPSSTGYKLSMHCTDAEKLACLAAWRSLREEVTKTEVLYSNHFHSLGLKL